MKTCEGRECMYVSLDVCVFVYKCKREMVCICMCVYTCVDGTPCWHQLALLCDPEGGGTDTRVIYRDQYGAFTEGAGDRTPLAPALIRIGKSWGLNTGRGDLGH